MRLNRLAALATVALIAAACTTKSTTSTTVSGTPVLTQLPAPVAYDPAGKWDIALTAQGQPLGLTMDLRKNADGTYGGSFTSDLFPPMTITTATLNGNKMVITLPVPTGDMATMNMTFNGALVEGEWSMPGDGSKLSGKRIG